MIGRLLAALAVILIAGLGVPSAQAQSPQARIAFVIGNGAYPAGPLANALNDAGLVAESLRSVGFEVIEGADLGQADAMRSFRDFLARAEAAGPDAVVFVYFSGYGFAFEGDDFLVAADAKLEREGDIPLDTMRLSDLMRALAGGPAGTKIMAIDAARRLPFALARNGLPPGLAPVEAPPGMLVGFSTAPGMIAPDGPGPYGAYATAIAEMVRGAGLDLADAFTRIRARTHQITEGQQTPWHVSALTGPVVLVPVEASPVSPAPAMPVVGRAPRPMRQVGPEEAYAVAIERDDLPSYVEFVEAFPRNPYAARVWAIIRARREALAWMRAVEINTPQSYWTYLRRYPRGIYAADAGRRLRRLAAAYEPPVGFAPIEFDDVPMALVDEPPEIVEYYPPAPPPPILLIEPRSAYFVDLPPPPPRLYGGLPVMAPLPVIPRIAPGARVPVNLPPGGRLGGPPSPQGVGNLPPGRNGAIVPNALVTSPPVGQTPPPVPGGRPGGTPPGAIGGPPPAPPPSQLGSATPGPAPVTAPLGGPAAGQPSVGGRIGPPPVPPAPPSGKLGSTAPAGSAPVGGSTTSPAATTTPGAVVTTPGSPPPQLRNRVGNVPPPAGTPGAAGPAGGSPGNSATGNPAGNRVITTPNANTLGGRTVNPPPSVRPIGTTTTTTTAPAGQGAAATPTSTSNPKTLDSRTVNPPPGRQIGTTTTTTTTTPVGRPPPPPQIVNRPSPPQPPQIVNRPPPPPPPQPLVVNRPPPPPPPQAAKPPPPPPPPVVARTPPAAATVAGPKCPPGKTMQTVNGQPTCK